MKKLMASLMALTMVFAVTGCSESEDSSSKADAKETTAATTTTEATTTTTTAATTAAEESEAPAETASSDVTDESEGGEEEDAGTYENNVYTGSTYSFTIDSEKWTMQDNAGVDCMFSYTDIGDDANLASGSINVISMSDDLLNGLTASDYADQIKATYESMEGYTITADEVIEFAGTEAYSVDVTGEIGTVTVYLNQVIVSENGNLVVITYGANDTAYDTLKPEFQTILDSFKLK